MTEWQNSGYTAFWQTHIGDVEASAAKRTPTAMTQPDVTAEADGIPTVSLQDALAGPEVQPEPAPEPEPIPEPEPEGLAGEPEVGPIPAQEPQLEPGFMFEQQPDLVIKALYDAVAAQSKGLQDLNAHVALLHHGLAAVAGSGLTELRTGEAPEAVHPGAPEGDIIPIAEAKEPDEIPSEQDAWDAAGAVEAETPVAPESPKDPETDASLTDGTGLEPELVLQFSPRHRYHSLRACIQPSEGDDSLAYESGCGQQSDAWEPKTEPAPGTHPCRKCWPKGE
jgi:hypothetical protein